MDSTKTPVKKPLPVWKRLLFGTCTLVLILALIEFLCGLGLWFVDKAFTTALIRERREFILKQRVLAEKATQEVLHPYLGWVLNPRAGWNTSGGRFAPNEFGIFDDKSSFQKRESGKLIVGLCGGSVALNLGLDGASTLVKSLSECDQFRGREIVLIRLGMSGYKQPQQLLLLTYLLSMGAEFDLMINVDGFNEIALHPSENHYQETHPSYPRAWKQRIQTQAGSRMVHTVHRYDSQKATRHSIASWFASLPFQNSWALNLIWKCIDTRYEVSMTRDLEAIMSDRNEGNDYQITGPPTTYKNDAEMYRELVKIWSGCSRQMNRVCQINGIEYYEFLQPNQYFPGSKPLGPEEKEVAIYDEFEPGQAVVFGYPLLIEEGHKLAEEGVRFYDLSMLFSKIDEPIYVDFCCHYNVSGNELLARAIVEKIANVKQTQ